MFYRKCLPFLFLLFVSFTVSGTEKDKEIRVPDWLSSDKPVSSDQVAAKDYPYLTWWVDEHAESAQDFVVRLFDKHQIVIFGEEHNVKEHKDFVINLIPRLYHEAGIKCIGWEFSWYSQNKQLEELINAPTYDENAVLQLARERSPDWNSKEHWEIIKAVWKLNKNLKSDSEKMRLIGLSDYVDIPRSYVLLKTKSANSPEFQEILKQHINHDISIARHVEEEILRKEQKGFLFFGMGHDWTQYQYPPEATFGIGYKPMGKYLKEKHGDKIFQIRTQASSDPSIINRIMKFRNHASVGFNMHDSPFASILVPVGKGAPDVPLSKLAEGYLYLGPRASLHSNTTIKGYVTERMFHKYKEYYNVCFSNGRNFRNAEEVDEYLQQHRWPSPR
jgi:hypothetical protein